MIGDLGSPRLKGGGDTRASLLAIISWSGVLFAAGDLGSDDANFEEEPSLVIILYLASGGVEQGDSKGVDKGVRLYPGERGSGGTWFREAAMAYSGDTLSGAFSFALGVGVAARTSLFFPCALPIAANKVCW